MSKITELTTLHKVYANQFTLIVRLNVDFGQHVLELERSAGPNGNVDHPHTAKTIRSSCMHVYFIATSGLRTSVSTKRGSNVCPNVCE